MTSIDFEVFYPHIKEVAVEVGCAQSSLPASPGIRHGRELLNPLDSFASCVPPSALGCREEPCLNSRLKTVKYNKAVLILSC